MKKASIKDIAQKTGFSVSTVSRALSGNGASSERTRTVVKVAATEMGYRPNLYARNFQRQKSDTIAFLVPDIENLLYPYLFRAMESRCMELGYTLLLCDTFDSPDIAMRYVAQLKGQMVDGFVFSTVAGTKDGGRAIDSVKEDGIPYVCLMRESPYGTDSIIADNRGGSHKAVDYLFSRGKKKIAYITGMSSLSFYRDRLQGYVEGLEENGIGFDSALVLAGFDGTKRCAYDSVKKFISKHSLPDAIFAASDPLAFDAMRALQEVGCSLPRDVSVIGFDNLPFGELVSPQLTSVSQPFKEMGEKAVDILVEKIADNRTVENMVYGTTIVERESVG